VGTLVDVRSRGRSRSDRSISLEIDRRSFDVRSNVFEVFRTIMQDSYAQCEKFWCLSEVVLRGGPINVSGCRCLTQFPGVYMTSVYRLKP
jgi:hypothetical protein